jgi:hypothetical protein
MSLTSDIAGLVATVNNLITTYTNKMAGINAAVAAAIAAVPSSTRAVYVDQTAGSDDNDGLTPAAPVQTLTKAIALGGAGRSLDVILNADYTLTQARLSLPNDMKVRLRALNGLQGTNKRKLYLGVHLTPNPDTPGLYEVGGFYCPQYGMTTLNVDSIEIIFPAAPAGGTMVDDSYNGLLKGNNNSGPPITGLEINYSTIIRPAGSVGVISGIRTHFLALFVKTSTFVSADLAGKWVAGVSAGTTPASVGWISSNLNTL